VDPSSGDRKRLAATFDASAAFYDDARPAYPAALFEDLVRLAEMPAGGRILEIGCGTGKATAPLARRGYRMLCLEPGANLVAVAREKLAEFPLVEVAGVSFEDWATEVGVFDLVMAATSIAWVDPAVRYAKSAAVLRPGGCLAIFWNAHVRLPGEDGFWEVVQDVYRAHAPHMVGAPPPVEELPAGVEPEMVETGLFEEVAVRHYPWTEAYDTDRYLKLMGTFSNHIDLPDETRERLFADIAALVDREFGGRVVKHQVAVLQVARRAAGRTGSVADA
jgi:SAM-dependent methyltransferase